MEDELEILNGVMAEDTQGIERNTAIPTSFDDINSERMTELTDKMRERLTEQNVPVVNRARGGGRPQGITNFLADPEVQNTIAAFGRAFAGPRSEAGGVLADHVQDTLNRRGTQAALEAAESGDPIAEAMGGFGDAGLAAGLQERRQIAEMQAERLGLDEREFAQRIQEFDAQFNLAERKQELAEINAENDVLLQTARLELDEKAFEERLEQIKVQQDLDERIFQVDKAYKEFLMDQESQNRENFALRTNEYIEMLNEQRGNIEAELDQIENAASNVDDLFGWFVNAQRPGSQAVQRGRSRARRSGVPGVESDAGRDQTLQYLEQARERSEAKLANLNSTLEMLQAVQSARLGAAPGGTGEAGAQPGATEQTAVTLNTSDLPTLGERPDGFYRIGGQLYEVEDGQTYIIE